MEAAELDEFDRRLLRAVQVDGRISQVALADIVHLSPSQCLRRLRRLEEAGVIARYVALLSQPAVGLGVTALVRVSLENHGATTWADFRDAVDPMPEVLECWTVAGDADYVLRIVAPDLKAFSEFLTTRILAMRSVKSVKSDILLDTLKSTTALPLL